MKAAAGFGSAWDFQCKEMAASSGMKSAAAAARALSDYRVADIFSAIQSVGFTDAQSASAKIASMFSGFRLGDLTDTYSAAARAFGMLSAFDPPAYADTHSAAAIAASILSDFQQRSVALVHQTLTPLNEVGLVAGTSVRAELLADSGDIAGATDWVDEYLPIIVRAVRQALSTCKSVFEVNNVIAIVTAVIALLALQVAKQSATTRDVEKLTASVQQGNSIAHEILKREQARLDIERERLEIERNRVDPTGRLLKVLETAHKMASNRVAALPLPELYAVKRLAFLNLKQKFQSPPVAVLQPGEVVNVIERAGKWVRVERLSPEDGTLQQGWVLKKYMEKLE